MLLIICAHCLHVAQLTVPILRISYRPGDRRFSKITKSCVRRLFRLRPSLGSPRPNYIWPSLAWAYFQGQPIAFLGPPSSSGLFKGAQSLLNISQFHQFTPAFYLRRNRISFTRRKLARSYSINQIRNRRTYISSFIAQIREFSLLLLLVRQ